MPHVFRAESVGTARIPIRIRSEILEHSTTQIVGNLSNLSDRKGQFRSDHSELFPTSFRLEPSGSDQFRLER